MYDKDEVRNALSTSDVEDLMNYFNAEPKTVSLGLICKTVCHNGAGMGKHKLYYYADNKMFHCYSGCQPASFDIFTLVQKLIGIDSLNDAIEWVASFFSLYDLNHERQQQDDDWRAFQEYERRRKKRKQEQGLLPYYDVHVLDNLPLARPTAWINEGITKKAMDAFKCRFDPLDYSVVIPHFDIDGDCCGIRRRTLVKDEERFGKYVPWVHNGVMYAHPLALNLYGINKSRRAIQQSQTAIIVEAEKSVLKAYGWYGRDSIVVATCGSSFSDVQFNLLQSLGVRNLIFAFDHDFIDTQTDEWYNCKKKVYKVASKFSSQVNVSIVFDERGRLGYKESPLDESRDLFEELLRQRFFI